jgi:hypothetical protein
MGAQQDTTLAKKISSDAQKIALLKKAQSGYGLLFLLLVGSVGYHLLFPLISHQNNTSLHNFQKLKKAKKQLVAYARSFPFTNSSAGNPRTGLPPMLPCPSLENVSSDGVEKGSCGSLNKVSVGLFPWKSLSTQQFFSAQGECLWYVVAGNVKRNNIQEQTHFNIDGDQWIEYKNSRAVAAILAPKQNRSRTAKTTDFRCRKSYQPSDIFSLDSSASFDTESVDVKINLANPDSFDVELVYRDEIINPYISDETYHQMLDSLGKLLPRCLAQTSSFSSSTLTWDLPFAAPMELSDDRKTNNYQEQSGKLFGRLPYKFQSGSLKDKCGDLFTGQSTPTGNTIAKSPLFRVWLHSKNLWFLRVFPACQSDGSQCLKDISKNYLAIIFYAHSPFSGQSRVSNRFDANDREDIENYLEGNNLAVFLGQTTTLTQSVQSNDQRFCLDLNKQVNQC